MVNPDLNKEESALNSSYYNVLSHTNVDSIWRGDMGIPNFEFLEFTDHMRFEPVGDHGEFYDHSLITPCYKKYFLNEGDFQHLKIGITYDHQQDIYEVDGVAMNRDDEIDIERNYYFIDDQYYVIYDDVKSSDHNSPNQFMNQLHFASLPVNNVTDVLDTNFVTPGKYRYLLTQSIFDH
jgi:hypothetical protein